MAMLFFFCEFEDDLDICFLDFNMGEIEKLYAKYIILLDVSIHRNQEM